MYIFLDSFLPSILEYAHSLTHSIIKSSSSRAFVDIRILICKTILSFLINLLNLLSLWAFIFQVLCFVEYFFWDYIICEWSIPICPCVCWLVGRWVGKSWFLKGAGSFISMLPNRSTCFHLRAWMASDDLALKCNFSWFCDIYSYNENAAWLKWHAT